MKRKLLVVCTLTAIFSYAGSTLATKAESRPRPNEPAKSSERPLALSPMLGPTRDDRKGRETMVDLAHAWAVGGGTFGYPFWDKAGHRWSQGQISTVMYREYVTGYRDRLKSGCDLLAAIEIRGSVPKDIPDLVIASCENRLEALQQQQRWLEALIELGSLPSPKLAAEGARHEQLEIDDQRAELQRSAVERERRFNAAIEQSYKEARIALNLAQEWLDVTGQERIDEGAFI